MVHGNKALDKVNRLYLKHFYLISEAFSLFQLSYGNSHAILKIELIYAQENFSASW